MSRSRALRPNASTTTEPEIDSGLGEEEEGGVEDYEDFRRWLDAQDQPVPSPRPAVRRSLPTPVPAAEAFAATSRPDSSDRPCERCKRIQCDLCVPQSTFCCVYRLSIMAFLNKYKGYLCDAGMWIATARVCPGMCAKIAALKKVIAEKKQRLKT